VDIGLEAVFIRKWRDGRLLLTLHLAEITLSLSVTRARLESSVLGKMGSHGKNGKRC
jgi:hypothetical protein